MLAVLIETLLQHRAEIVPEFVIFVGRFARLLCELAQHPPGQLLANSRRHRVRLQHLAADVEGQVLAVDNAAKEPQIRRQKTCPLIGDEDAPDIKLDPTLSLRVEQVEWFCGGHEQKAGIFEDTFCLVVQGQPWIIEAMADVVVELLVLLGGDFRPRTGP